MFEIWGEKTLALFDIWSFEHFLSGLSIGSLAAFLNQTHLDRHYIAGNVKRTKFRLDILAILFLAYMWEALEIYIELGYFGERAEYWMQGIEFLGNRLISDPFMMVMGYLTAQKYNFLVIPSRLLSLAWLAIHVFIFPHCMYLQHDILGI